MHIQRFLIELTVLSAAFVVAATARAEVRDARVRVDGVPVDYQVVVPDDFDESESYPAIVVFGGGPQTMSTIESAIDRSFRVEAESRQYIVIGPAAPEGELFFRGGDAIVPGFLDRMLETYNVRDRKFHVAGPSNGGIAAMHVAARYPDYFKSVTAFPGYLWEPSEMKLRALEGICVYMYIGENDRYPWHDEMQREAEYLRSIGSKAEYTVEMAQPHRLETLAGEGAGRLFNNFAAAEQGCQAD